MVAPKRWEGNRAEVHELNCSGNTCDLGNAVGRLPLISTGDNICSYGPGYLHVDTDGTELNMRTNIEIGGFNGQGNAHQIIETLSGSTSGGGKRGIDEGQMACTEIPGGFNLYLAKPKGMFERGQYRMAGRVPGTVDEYICRRK